MEWVATAQAVFEAVQAVKAYTDKDKEQNAYYNSSVAAEGRRLRDKWAQEKQNNLAASASHIKAVTDAYEWWRDNALRDIKRCTYLLDSLTLDTKAVFDLGGITKETVTNGNLNAYIQGSPAQLKILHEAVSYFANSEVWPKLASLAALILANRLLVLFGIGDDSIASAVQSKHIVSSGPTAFNEALASFRSWKSHYQKRRTDILAIQQLTSHSGPQQGLFGPREVRGTGIYQITFDEADGVLPGFAGKKSNDRDALNPFTESNYVHTAFEKCKANLEIIPKAIDDMRALITKARGAADAGQPGLTLLPSQTGTLPAAGSSELFDGKMWYRLSNMGRPEFCLDVVNDGAGNAGGLIVMANRGDFSGQHWTIHPQPTSGFYYISAMYQPGKRLDVYGDDKTRPHLADAGNYSGQNWKLSPWGDGTYRLTNQYSEDDLHLDMKDDGSLDLHLAPGDSPTQHWVMAAIRNITEPEFLN